MLHVSKSEGRGEVPVGGVNVLCVCLNDNTGFVL